MAFSAEQLAALETAAASGKPVPYTPLTLPPICSVDNSEAAA